MFHDYHSHSEKNELNEAGTVRPSPLVAVNMENLHSIMKHRMKNPVHKEKKNAQSTPRMCKISKFAQPVQNLHMHMHSPHDRFIGGNREVDLVCICICAGGQPVYVCGKQVLHPS